MLQCPEYGHARADATARLSSDQRAAFQRFGTSHLRLTAEDAAAVATAIAVLARRIRRRCRFV